MGTEILSPIIDVQVELNQLLRDDWRQNLRPHVS